MKIAVICANGKAGQLIVKEAIERGMDVTAVVRGENKSAADKVIVKDLFDLTSEDLRGFDAVVDAFGAWAPETLPQHSTSLKVLCDALSGTDTRLLVVGGAAAGNFMTVKQHNWTLPSDMEEQLKEYSALPNWLSPSIAAFTVKNTMGNFYGYTPADAAQDLKSAEGTVLLKYDGSVKTINNTYYYRAVR